MNAYIQHGEVDGPFLTVSVPCKEQPMPHHLAGLSYTHTGYGGKLPTRYMVQLEGRWRRVYSICYSNVSTEYAMLAGNKVVMTLEPSE